MQMSMLPYQTAGFKIYSCVEVMCFFIYFHLFLYSFKKFPMPWSSITFSYMKNAKRGFLWTPSVSDLGHAIPTG